MTDFEAWEQEFEQDSEVLAMCMVMEIRAAAMQKQWDEP